ncbi:Uncharacterized protein dnm_066370 [Desulfonema magnum]|uniref:Uncharacterized protein n=1 Tax=Desulfonema magnum TaxID=45655 RepID=A0A975BRV9_9BACT|nr:Uncharacterized protein dnm_066370 [Desulfonema magnum]
MKNFCSGIYLGFYINHFHKNSKSEELDKNFFHFFLTNKKDTFILNSNYS